MYVHKIWILNRIVNHHVEQMLINLLNQYNQSYIRIPFNWDKYRRISYYFPSNEYFNLTKFHQRNPIDKLQLIDTLYHQKNLYVMNNNGARNFALRHGKLQTRSQWLMIFDGNCFLSQQGFDEIYQSLLINGSRIQYFIVPLSRLINNNEVFHRMRPKANEEPQIIFRRDSTIEYLETIRYGQRSKEELLAYLGVRKPNWKSSIERKSKKNTSLFEYTGFVFRLYSGLNPNNERSSLARGCSRYEGVIFFLENLDFTINHYRLLPNASRTASHRCIIWSNKQLEEIIKTAQQIQNRKSVNIEKEQNSNSYDEHKT